MPDFLLPKPPLPRHGGRCPICRCTITSRNTPSAARSREESYGFTETPPRISAMLERPEATGPDRRRDPGLEPGSPADSRHRHSAAIWTRAFSASSGRSRRPAASAPSPRSSSPTARSCGARSPGTSPGALISAPPRTLPGRQRRAGLRRRLLLPRARCGISVYQREIHPLRAQTPTPASSHPTATCSLPTAAR